MFEKSLCGHLFKCLLIASLLVFATDSLAEVRHFNSDYEALVACSDQAKILKEQDSYIYRTYCSLELTRDLGYYVLTFRRSGEVGEFTYPHTFAYGIDSGDYDYGSKDAARNTCQYYLDQIYNNDGNGKCLLKSDSKSQFYAHDYDHDNHVRPGCVHYYRFDFNEVPSVSITSPGNNSTHYNNVPVTFRGVASDAEDGGLTYSIQWTFSDGFRTTGDSFTRSFSKTGTYNVRATVTDSDGAANVVTNTFVINSHGISLGNLVVNIDEDHEAYMPVPISVSSAKIDGLDASNSVRWESSLDGYLGVGKNISPVLKQGVHVITASLTMDGNSESKSVNVSISENKPALTIKSPKSGRIFDIKETISFNSYVEYLGQVSADAKITWTSSIDGLLSQTSDFSLSGLSEGVHTITVEGTADGKTAEKTLQLTVYDSEKNLGAESEGQCFGGNPINLLSGNKYHEELDFSTNTETPLYVKRSYNSSSTKKGLFGYGWSSNIEERIEYDSGAEQAAVVSESGAVQRFDLVDGVWVDDSSAQGKLERLLDGGWKYTLYNGTVKIYSNSGQILSITPINKLSLNFTYLDGNLEKIEDEYGHALTFTHGPNGYIETITNPDLEVFSYVNLNGNLSTITYPEGSVKSYVYENQEFPHALTGIIDEENVRYATWGYDEFGRANSSFHAENSETFSVAYNSDGSVTTTNALGKETTYEYESIMGILKVVSVNGHMTEHCSATYNKTTYHANGFPHIKTDQNNNRVITEYNDFGLVTKRTLVDTGITWGGEEETYTTTTKYNAFGLPELIIKPGLTTEIKYTQGGRIDLVTHTDTTEDVLPYSTQGETRVIDYSYTFYSDSDIVRYVDIDGPRTDVLDKTRHVYDRKGNLINITNALAQSISYGEHTSRGLPKYQLDLNGVKTSFEYTPRGWLKKVVNESSKGSATKAYHYYQTGLVESVVSPNNSSLTYTYNEARQLRYVTNNVGEKQEFSPNRLNGQWKKKVIYDADGTAKFVESREFDEKGRIRGLVSADGNRLDFIHIDANGNIETSKQFTDAKRILGAPEVSSTMPRKVVTRFDARNRLRSKRVQWSYPNMIEGDQLEKTAEYKYDLYGNLATVYFWNMKYLGEDEPYPYRRQETTYKYNGFGELIYEKSQVTGEKILHRDKAGNAVQIIDAEGVESFRRYDVLNRLIAVDFSGTSADISYVYDENEFGIGHLTTVSNQDSTIKYAYDDQGYVSRSDYTILGSSYALNYMYDKAGQLSELGYPSGLKVKYSRDLLGRVSQIESLGAGHGSKIIASNVTYEPFGPIRSLDYGSGLTRNIRYDQSYRPKTLEHNWLTEKEKIEYSYDRAGNVDSLSQVVERSGASHVWANKVYEYDLFDHINSVRWTVTNGKNAGSLQALEYTYDPAGNRLTKSNTITDERWVYYQDSFRNRLRAKSKDQATTNYSYFSTGQVRSDGEREYIYNPAQRLAEVKSGGALEGKYYYNSLGQRVSKVASGSIIHFHYDLGGKLLLETEPSGDSIRQYVYLDDMPIAMLGGAKLYEEVASSPSTLIGEEYVQLNASKDREATALQAIAGNSEISASLSDMSNNSGKESLGLTLREELDGQTGAKIDVRLAAQNQSTLNMITVTTPEGKVVPIPMFGSSRGGESLEINVIYSGGTSHFETHVPDGNWVKLKRTDQYISVYTSADGSNWRLLEEYNLPTMDQAYMGITASNAQAEVTANYKAANDNLFYLHTDHLGSVYAVSSNSTKSKVWQRQDFEVGASPFGLDRLANGDRMFQGLFEMPLRFPGQYHDKETGTFYNYFRDYDPETATYLQSDPIGLNGGINTYGYGLGNPTRFIDPLGLATLDFFKLGSLGQRAFQNTQAPDGETYVKGHGDRYGVQDDRTGDRVPMTVKELADKLREEGWKEGEPVTLVSCNTGDGGFPQQLADELGVPVTAPDGYVSAQYDGDFWSHHLRFPPVPWGSGFSTWSPQ